MTEPTPAVCEGRPMPLSELRRLQRALERFEALTEKHYPGYGVTITDGRSEDMSETVRNALTALAHIGGWIAYRTNHPQDPAP